MAPPRALWSAHSEQKSQAGDRPLGFGVYYIMLSIRSPHNSLGT